MQESEKIEFDVERLKSACVVRVVDDDCDMLRSYSFMLGVQGWKTALFESAKDFLSNPGHEPGCLILDVRMPGMSGLELLQEMKKLPLMLPIIFVTGHGNVDMAVHSMREGACDFMLKPVDPQRLRRSVLKCCQASQKAHFQALRKSARDQDLESLSDREREVAECLLQGKTNSVIAAELGIAERTVKFHRASISRKLGVHSVAEMLSKLMQGI